MKSSQLLRSRAVVISLTTGICLLPGFALDASGQEFVGKPKLILDADTANEIDDLYAIVRTLRQDKFEVLGLNSAQWFHYLGDPDSVQASQKLNEDLVRLLGREDLPTPRGSEQPMAWGQNTQPTSKLLENQEFTRGSRMDFGRRSVSR